MYADIAADPPDPQFTTVAQPSFSSLPTDSEPISGALMAALDLQTAYGETMLKAFERYQGAVVAGAAALPYTHAQAAALGRNGQEQVTQMYDAVDALRAKATELDTLPEFADPVVTAQRRDDLAAVYARVRTMGFTIDEIAQLDVSGLTSAEIDAVRSQFTPDPSVLPLDTTLQAMLRNLATALESAIPPLDRFARNASVVGGRTNIAPTASYTATPSSGPLPLTVAFASTSTSTDLDELTYALDFGDGTVETGSTVSTPTTEGTFVTSLTVETGSRPRRPPGRSPPAAPRTARPSSPCRPRRLWTRAARSSSRPTRATRTEPSRRTPGIWPTAEPPTNPRSPPPIGTRARSR